MQRLSEKADNVIKIFLRVFAGGILLYLLLLSMFSTSEVELRNFSNTPEADWGSYNYYLADSWQKCLIVLIMAVAVAVLIKSAFSDKLWSALERYRWILYLLFLIGGLFFIWFTKLQPISDPKKVMDIAEGMVNDEFIQFMPNDGYLWRCPHQMGIVFLCYCLTILFGEQNYLAFQVLNLAALICGLELAGRIAGIMWPEKGAKICCEVRMAYILFVPYFLYVTFIYGMIPAFVLSLAAMYMELIYIREKKWSSGVLAAILIAMAIIVKPNSKIMLVAMLIFLGYDLMMAQRKVRTLTIIVLMILISAVCTQSIHYFMSWKSGYPVSSGQAMLGYVAMGLQESRFGPGAYNGHSVSLYEQSGYDTGKATELAWDSIRNSMERFLDDKSEAVRWLGRKLASQWNEPAFGSIEVNRGRESEIKLPRLLNSMIYGKSGYRLIEYLNYFQTIILAGGVWYFLLSERRGSREKLLLVVAVIGGFIFHIFWEAKSQYVFPYFLLLFPYSVRGWECLADKIYNICRCEKKKALMKKGAVTVVAAAGIFIVLIAALYQTRIFQYLVAVQDEPMLQEEYMQRVEENCDAEQI